MGKKIRIRIRYEQPRSYFRELKKQLFGFKCLNSLMWIRDGKFGSGIKIGSGINIPDPQHWKNLAVLGTRSFGGARWTPVS
jgi:hypothetical protein